jgi:pseudaminic acid biosynthesis-associated methylase
MTEQEKFWAGKFGDEYTSRMTGNKMIESNVVFFADALAKTKGIKTVCELGCNKGLNLAALEYYDPSIIKTGVDINSHALYDLAVMFEELKIDHPFVHHSSILDFNPGQQYDLVFTKGVLIHINPDQLHETYEKIYNLSSKYILIAEYYNPVAVEVQYRGHSGKLYKRDFAGEILDKYDLKLVDYGFRYHRDKYPQDDLNWTLISKE